VNASRAALRASRADDARYVRDVGVRNKSKKPLGIGQGEPKKKKALAASNGGEGFPTGDQGENARCRAGISLAPSRPDGS
jgi:hypothetical protein